VPIGVTPTGSINPYQPSGVPTTYTARFVVRVQSARMDQVAGLAAALVTAGATSAVASQFEYSAADSVRRILYASALDQARRDAEALASALGGRLGQVLEATSNAPSVVPSGPPYVALSSSINVGGATPSPDVTVTATASVRYRFVPR
jgi:uncharacterized protein YggE